MKEEVHSEKFGLYEKVRTCMYKNIQALAAMDNLYITEEEVSRIIEDKPILTTKTNVSYVLTCENLFNYMGQAINMNSINVPMLAKMHEIYEDISNPVAGVIRQSYTPNSYKYTYFPAVVGREEVMQKLMDIQSCSDKFDVATRLFKYISEIAPFYSGNKVIAFIVAEIILIKYNIGYLLLEDMEKVEKLNTLLNRKMEKKYDTNIDSNIDKVLTSLVVRV